MVGKMVGKKARRQKKGNGGMRDFSKKRPLSKKEVDDWIAQELRFRKMLEGGSEEYPHDAKVCGMEGRLI